ncbi:hypothetical protein BH23BAC2_BH23BAC2_02280 [soil metagenome]
MKKDIEIPPVQGVFLAAVLEENKEFRSLDWNVYLINTKDLPLEMVLVVSRGFDKKDSTASMRHSVKVLPARSYAKIEFLQDDILRLTNEFLVTFFEGNKMYEKKYTFRENTINNANLTSIPVMDQQGILAE